MSEHSEHPAHSEAPPDKTEIVALIKKMQQHLVFIEKKIDALMTQSSERPFKGKHFPRSRRPEGHSLESNRGERGNRSGERNFSQGRPFNPSFDGHNRGFGQRKRPFFQRRKERH